MGNSDNGKLEISGFGEIVIETWNRIPKRFPCVTLDVIQLMPDHVHAILLFTRMPGQVDEIPHLGTVMQWWKGVSSFQINKTRNMSGETVWQDGYNERVICNEQELDTFRSYIVTNPLRAKLKKR